MNKAQPHSDSNSGFQLDLEKEILSSIQSSVNPSLKTLDKPIRIGSTLFHFDFANEDGSIVGEIYSCSFPLKSGHRRKINSDLLKMITYEKIAKGSEDKSVKKYLVLTINQDVLKKVDNVYECSTILTKQHDEFCLFGEKSWFSVSINIFNIEVLYYVLSDDQKKDLNTTREKQKIGMSSTGAFQVGNDGFEC